MLSPRGHRLALGSKRKCDGVSRGTPIQNRIEDLQALFGFLHVEPFSDPKVLLLQNLFEPKTSTASNAYEN